MGWKGEGALCLCCRKAWGMRGSYIAREGRREGVRVKKKGFVYISLLAFVLAASVL